MDKNKLFNTFLRDGESFTAELGTILIGLESHPEDKDLLNLAFRNAHSLKSEASFLKQKNIIEITHNMESVFDRFRNSEELINSTIIDSLLLSLDKIKEILDFLKLEKKEPNEVIQSLPAVNPQGILLEGTPLLSEFEKILLIESKERGEKFYRLIFELEDSTPLKYPKAYLLISNLEQKVNVIRTIPSFGEDDDNLYSKMSIYFTSNIKESEIYDSVNIDQVESIKLAPLLYESFLDETVDNPVVKIIDSNELPVKMSVNKLDQFSNYVDELKIQIYRLKRMRNSTGQRSDEKFNLQIDSLSELSSGLELLVKDISMVTLDDSFSSMGRYVRDLAKELGKEAVLELEGCNIKVERRAGEIISDIILHIIRNSVDHGLESSELRTSLGKTPFGNIKISAARIDDKLNITISDDGRGINTERIREIAEFKGLLKEGDEELDLISILTHPGISTRDNADTISGRGIGLDIVNQKIMQFENGELKITTDKGVGTSISLSIPGGFTLSTFQLVRCGSIVLAVPDKSIESTIQTDRGFYDSNDEGFLFFNGNPVFTIDGRSLSTDKTPSEEYGLILKNLDSTGVFLVDEILFKKDI
ncbi:MAG: ATP-binding protein, partial [Spirochaetota bacterium]|nr:ATP-binding protein [Spirochaetota bacterium]